MEKGILHLHVTIVIAFLLFFLFKTILLLANKITLLDKVREKTKVIDMILGTLILLTGGYLVFITENFETYILVKFVLILAVIPLGIVGFKKRNKVLAVVALFLLVYIYGIAETESIKFKKDKYESVATGEAEDASVVSNDTAAQDILSQNQMAGMNNAKLIYQQLCSGCHGTDGKLGKAGAKDLSKSTLSSAEKKEIILKGKNLMPKYKNVLSEQEVELLTEYINTFNNQ